MEANNAYFNDIVHYFKTFLREDNGYRMKNTPFSQILTIGLAIFSMFFGAGNLVYPLNVGLSSGQNTMFGIMGFILTAVCLPLAGLVSMILFDGNYQDFFNRMGKTTGPFMIFVCMLVIGPIIAIPRIVTLSHTMIAPFLPFEMLQTVTPHSSFIFALIFLGITYLATFRENRIVDLLGNFVSPALLISLMIIIVRAIMTAECPVASTYTPWQALSINFIRGYETLDLLGGIFFSSIVLHILKNTKGGTVGYTRNKLALIGSQAGALGVSLLALVYAGMSVLSMYHGHGMLISGNLFRELAFTVLGANGALVIATAVLMACFSTSIALTAVVGEYFQYTIFNNKTTFEIALLVTCLLCIPLSTFGLDEVLKLTGGPLVYVGYPALIALTFCNIAYKTVGFKPVKVPVAATFVIALLSYFWQ